MSQPYTKIVIVGGGTAGWLSACIIASRHQVNTFSNVDITLIESSDIPTVGVGEGTWPTMKSTLKSIGIKEKTFFHACHAAFKQANKFVGWRDNDSHYFHPFSPPCGFGNLDIAPYLQDSDAYSRDASFQHHVCEAGLAPRAPGAAEFQGPCNYGYHLDAGAFAELLKEHGKAQLGIGHVVCNVTDVMRSDEGEISCIYLENGEQVQADLYIDCTGFSAKLLGETLNVPLVPLNQYLFNDSALATRVDYEPNLDEIASHTVATAQNAGWIWDIGLTDRRGVGHVYASDFMSEDEAASNLCRYLGKSSDQLTIKKIKYTSGYRQRTWEKNCVAIGMSAGFVEPLEATAIMLVEISANFVADNLPATRETMSIVAKRFNEKMSYRWSRIVDFLKLHYVLNQRPEPYWMANKEAASIPESLRDSLMVWRHRGPSAHDFDGPGELFPAASYQYVLYGMGFSPDFSLQPQLYTRYSEAEKYLYQHEKLTEQLLASLPKHRHFIESWLDRR